MTITQQPYASQADRNTINSAILALTDAKKATNSETYSRSLRKAIMASQNLWKAENL